ncbi:HD domain-containing phosphohydrolase [Gordonia sp. CPCC 205515]|uniref:HD domain-containing phosphohydrolase n=1 Tax=Gordonia sp. CPCC 205515 TaxID=3140791 RepID=UPI003AF3E1F6
MADDGSARDNETVTSGRSPLPRRVEVLAGLSVAIDLGLGQPAEHMLRAAVIACRLSDRIGLTAAQRATVYYTTLVMWIGCHADSQEYTRWFGDDIAVRRDLYLIDQSGLPLLRFLVGNVARGEPIGRRAKTMASLFRDARGQLRALVHSHCLSAAALARHIGFGADVEHAIGFAFERYDGDGLPDGVPGPAIPIEMRVAQLADMIEVHQRMYGLEGAVAMARSRRGGHFDPALVDVFAAAPDQLFPGVEADPWEQAIALAPDAEIRLDSGGLDRTLTAIGDFADLKCPFALGHSRNVATLAESAAGRLGLPPADREYLRWAGHLHDVGRIGISNQVWSKAGDLTGAEWERVRMHPYFTDRVLKRISGLERVAAIARTHHEHLDGSGYPLGIGGAALGRPERVLAAATAYQSALEPRPYREPMSPDDAAARLTKRADDGALDPECVEAVLLAAGHIRARTHRTDALTPREIEILGLVARGMSNRRIAERLVLSEKTVRNHVERTYTKIGVSNRVGASLYALQNGLVDVD